MPQMVRDTSGFAPASHQSQALCLGTLGVSLLLWPIAVWGFGSPVRFVMGWVAAGVGVWLLVKARERWRLHGVEEMLAGSGGSPESILTPAAIVAAHSSLPPEVLNNEQYQRLSREVENPEPDRAGSARSGWGVITEAVVTNGELVSYRIRTKERHLARTRTRTDIVQRLEQILQSKGDSQWIVVTDAGDDAVVGTLSRNTLPAAAAPDPPENPVKNKQDAINKYGSARWVLGVDADGNKISYSLEEIPHVLVVGTSGGGKSVWARTTIEQLRTEFGFTCFIASGKVADFAALDGQPGIAMVAGDPAQTAVMVRTVRNEMFRRDALAANARRDNDPTAFRDPPILLLLDEWGATQMLMKAAYKKPDAFINDIDLILRIGREARIHVVLLSQQIRKTGEGAVPGSWQENLKLTVALGEPSRITLSSGAFTADSRPLATKLGPRLYGKSGRGLVAERETGHVIEFQSYYGWSPGTTSLDPNADKKYQPPTPAIRSIWERWVPVSDSVPWLLPRLGYMVDGPEWIEGDLESVADTPTIALTDKHGKPYPGREKYDPRSKFWIGGMATKLTKSKIEFDDEPENTTTDD